MDEKNKQAKKLWVDIYKMNIECSKTWDAAQKSADEAVKRFFAQFGRES